MKEETRFSEYVENLRHENGISVLSLCEGLCSFQEVSYLETGTRKLDRLLEEAILERLGVGAEDYEIYMDYAEYQRWGERHHIIHCISFEKFGEAERLLKEYHNRYCNKLTDAIGSDSECCNVGYLAVDKLEMQFYLSMQAQIQDFVGDCKEELGMLFLKALKLTVPMYEKRPIMTLILSLKELNLMLEAERHRKEGERFSRYREIVEYIEAKSLDRRGKAKLYPKAVYYLYRSMVSCGPEKENEANGFGQTGKIGSKPFDDKTIYQLLRHCDHALEILRDNGRMYFLWEILFMREKLLNSLQGECDNIEDKETLQVICQETINWRRALESVYTEFGVPPKTFDYCYLYVMKGVSCINDVIRIRRRMLGINAKELCEGICSVKTLRRLESCRTVPQRAIVKRLFERLGLSGELTRTELVTDSSEAHKLMEQLRESCNKYQWMESERLLEKVKKLVSTKIRSNQQALMRKELLIQLGRMNIEKEDYLKKMRTVLELTLPYDAFLQEGEKYLTYEEQLCILNMMQVMDRQGEELLTCMRRFEEMYRPYIEDELYEVVMGMYEVIMGYTRSLWGNMGEYDKADWHSRKMIEGCLRARRLWMLHDSLYDRWWNYKERVKKGIFISKALDDTEELTRCVVLSKLAKSNDEEFYLKKLERL